MPAALIPSFLFYCFVSGITPGPANLCSLGSALKYGRSRALRQWRGLLTGFALVSLGAVLITWFLGTALQQYVRVLSYIGAAYILWLAWHMLTSDGGAQEGAATACNFWTGVALQLTNVKVIIFCITALSAYALPYADSFWALLLVGAFLPFTGPFCNLVWLFAGVSLQKVFQKHQRPINIVMAASLAVCAVSLLV